MSGTAGAGVDLDFALHHPQYNGNVAVFSL